MATDSTKNASLNVTTWCIMVTVVIGVLTRLWTKYRLLRKLSIDDLLITTSSVFSIAQSIVISVSVSYGYGNHNTEVPISDLNQIMKHLYTGNLLFLLSLLCSKLSLVIFIRNLTPGFENKWLCMGVVCSIFVWATVTFFGSAFQCVQPCPWDIWGGQCFNLMAWRYFMSSFNILTEMLIFLLAMDLISHILSLERKLIVMGIFLPRVLVVAAITVEMTFVEKGTRTTDATYDMCELTILDIIIQSISILTACWPQLKPFTLWMRSNGLKIPSLEAGTYCRPASPQSRRGPLIPNSKPDGNNIVTAMTLPDRILITQDWKLDFHDTSDSSADGIRRSTPNNTEW